MWPDGTNPKEKKTLTGVFMNPRKKMEFHSHSKKKIKIKMSTN